DGHRRARPDDPPPLSTRRTTQPGPPAEQDEEGGPEQRERAEGEQPRPHGQLLVVDRPEYPAEDVAVRVELGVQPEVERDPAHRDDEPDEDEGDTRPAQPRAGEGVGERHAQQHTRRREQEVEAETGEVPAVRPPEQRRREERPREREQEELPPQHRPEPAAPAERPRRRHAPDEEPRRRHDRARLDVQQPEQRHGPQREPERRVDERGEAERARHDGGARGAPARDPPTAPPSPAPRRSRRRRRAARLRG